jgi:hypothetical protein
MAFVILRKFPVCHIFISFLLILSFLHLHVYTLFGLPLYTLPHFWALISVFKIKNNIFDFDFDFQNQK